MALSQISDERKNCLKDLKGLLEDQLVGLEVAEKVEREEKRAARSNTWEDDDMLEADELLEKLTSLERLQERMGNVGDEVLARTRKNASQLTLRNVTSERDEAVSKLSQLQEEHGVSVAELQELQEKDAKCAGLPRCSIAHSFPSLQLNF